MWCVVISPQISWCLVCYGCCYVEIPQMFLEGMWKVPSYHIPIGLCWWVWQEKCDTCYGFWRWCLSIMCVVLPSMHLLLLGVRWCHNPLIESRRFRSPINWSARWRWLIIPLLWWFLFLCDWCILHPHVCFSVSHFIFLEVQGGVSGVSER